MRSARLLARIATCEELVLGDAREGAMLQRIEALENTALGAPGAGALPDRVAAVETALGLGAPAPPAPAPAPAAPAAIDPDVARRFLAVAHGAEPWSCAGPEQLSPWWEGTVVRQLGDWNKKDQKPTLRALTRVFGDGPTILARCCDEIDKAPFTKLQHAPDGTKLNITFGLKELSLIHI